MKPVVAPQNDDGVVLHRRGLQSVEQAAELMIRIAHAREVALHEFLPLFVFEDPLVPWAPAMIVRVGQVVSLDDGQLHIGERIKVEPLCGTSQGMCGRNRPTARKRGLVCGARIWATAQSTTKWSPVCSSGTASGRHRRVCRDRAAGLGSGPTRHQTRISPGPSLWKWDRAGRPDIRPTQPDHFANHRASTATCGKSSHRPRRGNRGCGNVGRGRRRP